MSFHRANLKKKKSSLCPLCVHALQRSLCVIVCACDSKFCLCVAHLEKEGEEKKGEKLHAQQRLASDSSQACLGGNNVDR